MWTRRALLTLPAPPFAHAASPIDRKAVVTRHNPTFRAPDVRSPLSLGNGEFAFTADFTGLQSFSEPYEQTTPLCAQSQWGCHSLPSPGGKGESDLRLEPFDTYGRPIGYATNAKVREISSTGRARTRTASNSAESASASTAPTSSLSSRPLISGPAS